VSVKGEEVRVEDISTVKKKLFFDIPWEDVRNELDTAYKTISKKAKIKGFRPGKTPKHLLERYFKDQAEEEAINNLVTKSYQEAVKNKNLKPVNQPNIEQKGIEKEKNFGFAVEIEIDPVIDPKDYTDLTLVKEKIVVTESDVSTKLEELRHLYSTLRNVEEDRGVQDGDFVLIDFEGRINQEIRKELTEQNFNLEVGSKRLVPGFEEQITGMKKDEMRDIRVKFPDDYPVESLAGQEADFRVVLKDIKVKVLPEINEDFVKNFQRYETLDQLKKELEESLHKEAEFKIKEKLKKDIIEKLLESNEFEVPEAYVERQVFSMMADTQRRMMMSGMDNDKATELVVKMHDKFRDDARRIVKTTLLLHKIAEKESLTVTDEEIEERLKEIASRYARDYDTVRKSYEKDNMILSMQAQILEEKTLDFIEVKANITIREIVP
jgi:trigger factor